MRWRGIILDTTLLAAVSIPGHSCGRFFLEVQFTQLGLDLEALHRGAPVIIAGNTRELSIAYCTLSGAPLTEAEWTAVLKKPASSDPSNPSATTPSALTTWTDAR